MKKSMQTQTQTQTQTLTDSLRQLDSGFRAGRFAEVEQLGQKVLQRHPKSPQVWYLLGMAVLSQGRLEDALPPFRRALEFDPRMAPALFNLGFALERLGRLDDAIDAYRRTLAVAPKLADAYNNLGNVLQKLKRHDEALAAYDQAIALMPQITHFWMNRGNALRDRERLDEAVESYRKALELEPNLINAYVSQAHTLVLLKRYEESVAVCQRAIERRPDFCDAHMGMADALRHLGRHEEAVAAYRRVAELRPDDVSIYKNIANVLHETLRNEEALATLQEALRINPGYDSAFNLMAGVLLDLGRHDEAFDVYRRGLQLDPDGLFLMHSNYLLALNYQATGAPEAGLSEARAYGKKAARKARPYVHHDNPPDPGRRLRVGLVSGDFGQHPVGYFLENVIESLDPAKLELFAYATTDRKDALNARLRRTLRNWRNARFADIDDESLSKLIRADGIDILIDLAGHTAKNRLPVFAWKPAPVQAAWLGYFATTGLEAMDYILADRWVLPPTEEGHFVERPWRLPDSYYCFSPPDMPIGVAALPALASGPITFACFNNLTKVNDRVIACWVRVLRAVPGSRLFLKSKHLGDALVAAQCIARFARHGIGVERLRLEGESPRADYLAAYNEVDIALDPFPFPGGTTSVEGLWMGVPVLTLRGDRFISHQGETILRSVGLPQWIASDEDDYVAKAAAFAGDLPALAALRAGLRDQLLASPLCDAPRFARNLEEAFRGMWRSWCERQHAD